VTNKNSLGYGQHGDYVFGWKDDSLQKAMDSGCYLRNCTQLTALPIKVKNKCQVPTSFREDLDSCEFLICCCSALRWKFDDTGCCDD